MSLIFNRPDPKTANEEDVREAIREMVNWHNDVRYSFAHIVIDDMNLDDTSILFCLKPKEIEEWLLDKLPSSRINKKQYLYNLRCNYEIMCEIIMLLYWLLAVPEEIRLSIDIE